MLPFLKYLLQCAAWLAPLYLLYFFLFRRFSFYRLNRIYLLTALAASFLLPLVQVRFIQTREIFLQKPVYNAPVSTAEAIPETVPATAAVPVTGSSAIPFTTVLSYLYLAGLLYMLVRFLLSLCGIYRLWRKAEKEPRNGLQLAWTEKTGNASFFNLVFLNRNLKNTPAAETIIAHEARHVYNGHSFDVLIAELVRMVQWFNPFIYWYKKSLRELHEFEADAQMPVPDKQAYATALLQMAVTPRNAFVTPFSRKPLQTRITRLFQPQTRSMKKALFLLALPVIVAGLFAFRNIMRKTVPVFVKEKPVLMIDAGHGGKQPGVLAENLAEKNLTLAIAEKIKQQAEAAGFTVQMTRTNDIDIPVMDRVKQVNDANPDMLVSIHINGDANAARQGIEAYAGGNNTSAMQTVSRQMANQLLQSLSGLTGIGVNREPQSRPAGIAILKMTNCPALILECGYLTNSEDRAFIGNAANQEAIAKKIVEGIVQFTATKTNAAMVPAERTVVPLEAKVPSMYNMPENGVLVIDGKEMPQTVLPDVDPALIRHSVYFEPETLFAIQKYGEKARNGMLRLETKSGKGVYAFTSEADKEKWMDAARANRRINTTERYARFSYTDVQGKPAEVLVVAGGARHKNEPTPLRMVYGSWGGMPLNNIHYIVDGKEVKEEEFIAIINSLPQAGYEIVFPAPVIKKEKSAGYRVEIKKLNGQVLQALPNQPLPYENKHYNAC